MKIPLTHYGFPQVVVYPALVVAAMAAWYVLAGRFFQPACGCSAMSFLVLWLPEVLLFAVLVWMLSFFRDPSRSIPTDPSLLLSPADGKITAIETMPSGVGFDGPVLRIEIFLSIFNVHINRTPCAVRIGQISYKPGKFVDARRPDCSKINEANEVEMFRLAAPGDWLLVRQVSGAIARRIVCALKTGQECAAGEQFGMIKFGSCTELYVPVRDNLECITQVGQNVKAGLTTLARYK